jgi:hypothetical protein
MTRGGLVQAKICDFSTPWLSRSTVISVNRIFLSVTRGRTVVYVPKGMTREKITRIADALMALDGGVTAPPWDHSEACFLATVVLEALRPRRGQT